MSQHDVIIVGGGISGMSLAHYCAKAGLKPLVLDGSGRLGGTFNTCRRDGYWFELGAHTCYNSYGNLVDLLRETGSLEKAVKPGSAGYRIYTSGGVKSIMSQMSIPELLVSVPNLFGTKMEGQTVESYYSKVFGKRNYQRAIGPMFSAVICQKADDFPADMLFKKRERRKEVLRKFSLQGGLQSAIDAIAADPAIETVTGREATAIEFDGNAFAVAASDGGIYESKQLALAVPSAVAAALLKTQFPQLADKLASLKAERVETLGVIVRNRETGIAPIAALAAADDIFYSFVSHDTFPDPDYRAFAFHFRRSAGSRDAKLDCIARVLGTRNFEHVAEAEHVIPSLRLGHREAVAEIDGLLAGTPLLLTGNYFGGVAIEDCVSRSLHESGRLMR